MAKQKSSNNFRVRHLPYFDAFGLVLLVLSAAFDNIENSNFLNALDNWYGLDGLLNRIIPPCGKAKDSCRMTLH